MKYAVYVVIGLVGGALTCAADSIASRPRISSGIVSRIEAAVARLEKANPTVQQSQTVNVQPSADANTERRMFIEQLAASYRDGK